MKLITLVEDGLEPKWGKLNKSRPGLGGRYRKPGKYTIK